MRREPSIGPHSEAWPSLTTHGVLFLMFTRVVIRRAGFVLIVDLGFRYQSGAPLFFEFLAWPFRTSGYVRLSPQSGRKRTLEAKDWRRT